MSIFDQYRKLQEQFARINDSLGLEKFRQIERLYTSPLERVGPSFYNESLVASIQRSLAGVGVFEEIHRGMRGVSTIADLQSRLGVESELSRAFESTREISRAFETASSISRFTSELARIQISTTSLFETTRGLFDVSSAFSNQFEAAKMLSERVSGWPADTGARWMADLQRGMTPWLTAHQELWPNDVLLLRMLPGQHKLGAASWTLAQPTVPEHADTTYFGLGAITNQRVEADASITVELELCCALCRSPILPAGTEASWVAARKMHLKIEVVPICENCTARDDAEPGYIRNALIDLLDDPQPETRPRLEIMDGGEAAPTPTPRGVLKIVRDDDDDDDLHKE